MTETLPTFESFLAEIEAGAKWGWKDRREIDGTIHILTGPNAGLILAPSHICKHPLGFAVAPDGKLRCGDCRAVSPGECVCGSPYRSWKCMQNAHLAGPRLSVRMNGRSI